MNTKNLSDRELLEEILEQVEDNTKVSNKLLARAKFQNAILFIKWFIYIGILVGLYAFVQPFLNQFLDTYRTLHDGAEAITEIKAQVPSLDLNSVIDLLK